MKLFQTALRKAHTVLINRTRKGLGFIDDALYRAHPNSLPIPKNSDAESFHPLSLPSVVSPSHKLINIPLIKTRVWYIFVPNSPFQPQYVGASKFLMPENFNEQKLRFFLRTYYRMTTGITVAEYLDLPPTSPWSQYPAYASVLPWENKTVSARAKDISIAIQHDAKEHGHSLTLDDGWPWTGPVTDQLLELEIQRLAKLQKSLRFTGYKTLHLGRNVAGVLLYENPKRWCVVITPGQHRVISAATIGLQSIPIEIKSIIRRSDVKLWPQVQQGHLTTSQALHVFDLIMSGRLPRVFSEWKTYVQNHVEL